MKALAIAGFGKLGSALVRGALAHGVVAPSGIAAWARSASRQTQARELGLSLVEWPEVLHAAPVILLALKPQVFEAMTRQAPRLPPETLVISVMGGWRAAAIGARLGTDRVIRAMPSVAAAVGAGTTAICIPEGVPSSQASFAEAFFGAAGPVVRIPETAMDAATAVGASGVGFACEFLESLERAGLESGLAPEAAVALALGALEGAAAAVRKGLGTAAAVREQVTSPGGTTAAGVAALRAGHLQETVRRAVRAACDRAAELGAAPKS